jgi:hypothetical protein
MFVDCLHTADITFVVDASSNIHEDNFIKTKKFLENLLDYLNVESGQSNVAMVTYADNPKIEFALGKYHGRTDLKAAIDRATYTRGSSNLADTLRMLREQVQVTLWH